MATKKYTPRTGSCQPPGNALPGVESVHARYQKRPSRNRLFFETYCSAFLNHSFPSLQGHLHQADQTCRQALQQALERGGHQPAMGPAYVGRGDLEREWNHLDAATSLLQEGITLCEQTGNTQVILQAYIGLAFIHQAQGDADGASALMRQAVHIRERQHRSLPRGTQVEAAQAWLFLMQGDETAALGWVQRRGLSVDQELHPLFCS